VVPDQAAASSFPDPGGEQETFYDVIYLAAILAIAFFAVGLGMSGVVPAASGAVQTTGGATRILQDKTLTDLEKERGLQRASVSLLRSFVSIAVRGGSAFAAGTLPVVLFQVAGLARASEVTDWLVTWEAIVLASASMILVWILIKRR
jgi:hypothetical protein